MVQTQKEAAMENFKEIILKLCNSEPNGPLTTTQTCIIEQHLSHLASSGLQTTPDHPPYSWMIESALKELEEEGGCTVDSISEWIKEKYNNLPWAHMTLLKHHLQKMWENGELLMVDRGRRFLLPVDGNNPGDGNNVGDGKNLSDSNNVSDSDSEAKSKKKRKKRKDTKQKNKLQQKGKKRVQHDDNVQLVTEQSELDVLPKVVVTVKGNHEQQNGRNKKLHRGVKRIRIVHKQKEKQQQPDITAEGPLVASESDVGGSNAVLVPIEQPPMFMMTEDEIAHLADLGLQHQETGDICNLYPQEILENDNLPQILSPEVPPGFEFTMLKDASANNVSASVDLEDHVVHQNSEIPVTDGLSSALEQQSKESLNQQEKQQNQGDSKHTNDGPTQSALNPNQQQSLDTERPENEFVAEDLSNTKKQQKKRPKQALEKVRRERTATPTVPLRLTLRSRRQEQHISDRDGKQVQPAMESSPEPKQLPVTRKKTRTQLKGIITQPASSTDLEQENSSESKQQVDIQKDIENTDTQQLTELSKTEGSQEIVLSTVEPLLEKQPQCQEGRSPVDKLNEDNEADMLLLQKPAVSIEESPHRDRAQRQLKRWSINQCEPEPVSASKVESLPLCTSADHHLLKTEEPLALALADHQHEVHSEQPADEEALGLIDPQPRVHPQRPKRQCRGRTASTNEDALNEVNLDQPKRKRLGMPPKPKENEDKQDNGTISSFQQKNKRVARRAKPEEDGEEPDTTILKNLRTSKRRKAQ